MGTKKDPTVTEPESPVQFVRMQKGGSFIDVHPSVVAEHRELGWQLAAGDGAAKNNGVGISDADLIQMAKSFLASWAEARRAEGWSSADLVRGEKTTHKERELVEIIKDHQIMKVHPDTLADHISIGWTPTKKTIDMVMAGKKISVSPDSLRYLLAKGWEIYSPPEFLGPIIPWPPVSMWLGKEKIEVNILAVVEHAVLGWSVEPLTWVISPKGDVQRIRLAVLPDFLKVGWKEVDDSPTTESKTPTDANKSKKILSPAAKE